MFETIFKFLFLFKDGVWMIWDVHFGFSMFAETNSEYFICFRVSKRPIIKMLTLSIVSLFLALISKQFLPNKEQNLFKFLFYLYFVGFGFTLLKETYTLTEFFILVL